MSLLLNSSIMTDEVIEAKALMVFLLCFLVGTHIISVSGRPCDSLLWSSSRLLLPLSLCRFPAILTSMEYPTQPWYQSVYFDHYSTKILGVDITSALAIQNPSLTHDPFASTVAEKVRT